MTDVELDRIYETAIAEDWEEQNREDPREEIVRVAAHKAYKLLSQAFDVLGGAIDEGSEQFDSVESYCNDIEDMMYAIAKEKWF